MASVEGDWWVIFCWNAHLCRCLLLLLCACGLKSDTHISADSEGFIPGLQTVRIFTMCYHIWGIADSLAMWTNLLPFSPALDGFMPVAFAMHFWSRWVRYQVQLWTDCARQPTSLWFIWPLWQFTINLLSWVAVSTTTIHKKQHVCSWEYEGLFFS